MSFCAHSKDTYFKEAHLPINERRYTDRRKSFATGFCVAWTAEQRHWRQFSFVCYQPRNWLWIRNGRGRQLLGCLGLAEKPKGFWGARPSPLPPLHDRGAVHAKPWASQADKRTWVNLKCAPYLKAQPWRLVFKQSASWHIDLEIPPEFHRLPNIWLHLKCVSEQTYWCLLLLQGKKGGGGCKIY